MTTPHQPRTTTPALLTSTHRRRLLTGTLAAVPAALGLPAWAQSPQRIGVLMLHGKNPGSNQDPNMSRLKPVLEGAGMLTLYPDMPWSRGRYLDGHFDLAMAEIATHVKTLRGQGATHIVIAGHSMGSPTAMAFAARGGDVQALVLLAPGHVPARYYTFQQNTTVRDSVDAARKLVAEGKGDVRERFSDINQGRQLPVVATAKEYLSYFDPASDADMGVTAPRIPPTTPVLTVVGDADSIRSIARSYFVDKLPANPKSQYLEVQANHLTTPVVASEAVVKWIKDVLAA